MLALLSAIFGFAAPFLPELFKIFTRRADNAHELAMMRLRMDAAAQEHIWRMEEISANADIAEAREIHRPAPSFGVQMLDAAKGHNFGKWALVPAFYMFAMLDFLSGMVRPTVTYAAFGFYIVYKLAAYRTMSIVSDATFTWNEGILKLWGEQDWALLTLIISYWFGLRAYRATFGGSASTAKPTPS